MKQSATQLNKRSRSVLKPKKQQKQPKNYQDDINHKVANIKRFNVHIHRRKQINSTNRGKSRPLSRTRWPRSRKAGKIAENISKGPRACPRKIQENSRSESLIAELNYSRFYKPREYIGGYLQSISIAFIVKRLC